MFMFLFNGRVTQGDQRIESLDKGIDGNRTAEDGNHGGRRHVLDHTYTVSFWCFGRTDVSILRVMLLTRSNQFARLFNGSRDTTKMGNASGVVHAIEDLRYANLVRSTDFAAAKVACRQGGFEADIHDG